MTGAVLHALEASGRVAVRPVTSRSSMPWGSGDADGARIPWATRSKPLRLLADHLHPWLGGWTDRSGLWYYPKGFMPFLVRQGRVNIVTVHDVILQHYQDRYPGWRSRLDYWYWIGLLKHTLRAADRILTVSQTAKGQIEAFMARHGLPPKEVTVTYEPCAYEELLQPEHPAKEDYVLHLCSREPHKKTEQLIRWWHAAEQSGRKLPLLRLVGMVPSEAEGMVEAAGTIERRPFLADDELRAAYRSARALIFPSEIEGFGLPALEAYYSGTPVCFVKGTAVEEVLGVATAKGGFDLADQASLFAALDEVLAMAPGEVRECGLRLREEFAAAKVAERMLRVFEEWQR
jgi:glycosyltransferase involved in cell wall biosynthesis